MPEQMMRMAGRDSDGLAKAIKTDEYGQLEVNLNYRKLMTETVSNRTITVGSTFTSDFLETGGLKELVISTTTNNYAGHSFTVKEFNYNDDTAQVVKETVLIHEDGGTNFAGHNKNISTKIESPYVKIEVKNNSTALDLRIGLYVIAKDTPFETDDINLNYRKLMTETRGSRPIQPSETITTDFLETVGLKELVIDTSTNNFEGYRLTVKEFNHNHDSAEVVRETPVRNEKTGGTVFAGPYKNISTKIENPYVKIEVENTSTELDLEIGLYIVAKGNTSNDELSTENVLKRLLQEFSKTTTSKTKVPVVKNVNIVKDESVNFVQDFQNGLFYGTRSNMILTSEDGEVWTELTSVPYVGSPSRTIAHLFKTDTGRLVACCYGGDVFISDEDEVFGEEPNFTTGTLSHMWGSTRHANVIGFTTYGTAGLEEGRKHEAWLSVDNGATFKKIFDESVMTDPKFPTLTDTRAHLHDIEYDPYSNRIFVWAGDFNARCLYYSDTMGETWELFGNQRGFIGNTTQLIAGKYGLALGADTEGGGVGFIHIDRSRVINPALKVEDLDDSHWRMQDPVARYLSTKKWTDRENDIYLIPASPEYNENGRTGYLAYSNDGREWTIIWNSPDTAHTAGLTNIVYGNGKLVGTYHKRDDNDYQVFTADFILK